MDYQLDDILKSLDARESSRCGIATAASYLNAVAPCFGGDGLCPVKVFQLGSSEQWQKELADAAGRLTYSDGDNWAKAFDGDVKSLGDDYSTLDAALVFDTVLTTRRKDRDGDVVEPKGLRLDARMPLLWQHIQLQPIGKVMTTLEQGDEVVKTRAAIANTELGRDAATLTKFGALRTSHGFKPTDFTPVSIEKGADGKDRIRGWHIKSADVMEQSLVSIPANPDARVLQVFAKEFDGLCTAHSRGELKAPLVQRWAGQLYEKRTVIVPGVDVPGLQTKEAKEGDAEAVAAAKAAVTETKAACACGAADKAAEPLDVKAGRKFSAHSKECMKRAMDHMMAAHKEMQSLFDSGEMESMDGGKAVEEVEEKSAAEREGQPALSLQQEMRRVISKCLAPNAGLEGVRALEVAAEAAVLLKKQREESEYFAAGK